MLSLEGEKNSSGAPTFRLPKLGFWHGLGGGLLLLTGGAVWSTDQYLTSEKNQVAVSTSTPPTPELPIAVATTTTNLDPKPREIPTPRPTPPILSGYYDITCDRGFTTDGTEVIGPNAKPACPDNNYAEALRNSMVGEEGQILDVLVSAPPEFSGINPKTAVIRFNGQIMYLSVAARTPVHPTTTRSR